MSGQLRIQLVDGKRVRDPNTNLVLEPGRVYKVKAGQFWFRRLEAGDVVTVKEKKPVHVEKRKKKKGVE